MERARILEGDPVAGVALLQVRAGDLEVESRVESLDRDGVSDGVAVREHRRADEDLAIVQRRERWLDLVLVGLVRRVGVDSHDVRGLALDDRVVPAVEVHGCDPVDRAHGRDL